MSDTNGFRRTAIVAEIHAERDRQDEQWGGPEHDDTHNIRHWFGFIGHQILRFGQSRTDARERLIKIAALAIAGLESIDRQFPNSFKQERPS